MISIPEFIQKNTEKHTQHQMKQKNGMLRGKCEQKYYIQTL